MVAFIALYHAQRRPRQFRERTRPLDFYNDGELISRYRLPRQGILDLIQLVEPDVSPICERSHSLDATTKTLVTLRYLAKGDFFSETGDLHGVSRSSVSRCVEEVISSLNHRLDTIKFPLLAEEIVDTKRKFYRISGIPNTIGAVDGTLIPILAPSGVEEAAYVCRKGYHAINVQAVVDADMRFTDVVAKYPGSQHDAGIFDRCGLKAHLERTDCGWLLGDSGYPLRRYLMTPKPNPVTPAETSYNLAHSRTRIVVERAFGILKSRFRCLHKSGGVLPFQPGKCCKIVNVCMKLHNKCMDMGVPLPEVRDCDRGDNDNDIFRGQPNNNAAQIRQRLINSFL